MSTSVSKALLQGTIDVALVCIQTLSSAAANASVAKARVPVDGRIIGVTPIYGRNAGSVKFTDIDGMVENGTTDIFSAVHALVDSSADQTGDATIDDDQRDVSEGDILHLDLTTVGGTSPESEGYGYIIHILPS